MKNITKKIILLLVVGFFGLNVQAQTMKQRVADRLYDELSFFQAVEMYKDLAKKDDANAYLLRRTAECYRFLGETEKSEEWYSKLVAGEGAIAEDYYHYAQMAKMNENYGVANDMMAKFNSASADNTIGKAHASGGNYVDELKSNPDRYSINILDKKVNTEHSDFGPNYLTVDGETKLTFASAKRNMSLVNEEFQWDGSHFLDVYESALGADGESTEVTRFDKGVKSRYHEGPASFSNNGTKLYLTRSNYLNKKKGLDTAKHNNLKLYMATRDSVGAKWSDLVEFPYNSDEYSLGHATVTEDGETMYFSSDMPGGKGVTDIWKSTFENGSWTKPENVEEINTEGREMFPYLGEEGMLYVSSDGHLGLGGLDLYRMTPEGDGFSEPLNMGYPLNTNFDDFAMIINADETEGYFSSNRTGGESFGNDDIYRFKNLEPFPPAACLAKGCALEDETGVKLAGVTVNLISTETQKIVQTLVTKEDGCYEFKDLKEGSYKIQGILADYTEVSGKEFSTEECKRGVIEPVNTVLKKRDCGLIGTIVDKVTGAPIPGTSIVMIDKNNGKTTTMETDENGKFFDPIAEYDCPGGLLNYDFTIEKQGYLPKRVNFTKAITKPGIVEMEEALEIIAIGTEISELCGIQPLLYDFDKSYIRPDAAIELDKLVQCMNENPDMIVEIGSHTDCRASMRYNEKLSERRAKSARQYVISKGIAPYRIFGKGYGETRLLNGCACEPTNKSDCTDEQHQANRRTEFRIVSGGSGVSNGSTNSFD